jgi:hypothetical protein
VPESVAISRDSIWPFSGCLQKAFLLIFTKGDTTFVRFPAENGNSRQLAAASSVYGGERYEVYFGDDITSTKFFYDTWVYLASPSIDVANIEMAMNQPMKNGQTVIYGFQCDGWSSISEYTEDPGTPSNLVDDWVHSKLTCNPHPWSTNTSHHVQVSYSRDDPGNITDNSVALDRIHPEINATMPSARRSVGLRY